MRKSTILIGIVVILAVIFLGLQVFEQLSISYKVRPFILPLLTLAYVFKYKDSQSFFFLFLLFFSIAELLSGIIYFDAENITLDNFQYYTGNICLILAYIFLILEIYKTLKFKEVLKLYPIHILILLALDVYCIVLVSKISINSGFMEYNIEYIIEVVYNCCIMLLLTIALINYLHNDSNKSMSLLIASICLLFSEVIQVAFYYVKYMFFLEIISSILLVTAFSILFVQAKLNYADAKKFKTLDKLEA
ncbi:MAG: hypothetical protein HKO92_01355 [Flavobacteriaceae bacterium]|nr:hypothetical protein [Bacteroidia bacterium]NNK81745.1 hypothetical protein [Flavobacteriaceae bacterium]